MGVMDLFPESDKILSRKKGKVVVMDLFPESDKILSCKKGKVRVEVD
jgi:hypothetical protein